LSQQKEVIKFYTDDKTRLWRRADDLLETVRQLSELVNSRRVVKQSWTEAEVEGKKVRILHEDLIELCGDEDFFDVAGPYFMSLVTRLAAESSVVPAMLRWGANIVESSETGPQPAPGSEQAPEPQKTFREKLLGMPKQIASGAFTVFAPPPLEAASPPELVRKVNTLPAEFRRLQITAQDGWLDPTYCREELAVIVAETVGWVHSETFSKIVDRIQDIGRISGSVISKL